MILIGLTGGVATGKSTVALMFRRLGAMVIDADRLARQVVTPGTPAWRKIRKAFGTGILNPDGTVDRCALGAVVFRDRAKRRMLENIVHPFVAREQRRLTKAATTRNPKVVVIYDVPLLFETGIDRRVDYTIVVTAAQSTQLMRLRQRNGLNRADALRRIQSQMPLDRKARRANWILDGSDSPQQLHTAVRALYKSLKRLA
nr:dephospho-CoA kinase [Nitrospira sp. KM1]